MYSGLTDSIWKGGGRKAATLYLNGAAVTAELLSMTISGSVNGDREQVTIGCTYARTVTVQFSNVQTGFSDGLLQLEIKEGTEVLPIGVFRVTEVVTKGGQTTLTAVDAMLYLLDRDYTPAAHVTNGWTVLSDIVAQSGIVLGTSLSGLQKSLSAVNMSGLGTENTYRTVVGWLAALCGRNAVISRSGALEFLWYTDSKVSLTQQECYDGMDEVQESDRVFSMLAVTVTDQAGETRTLTPSGTSGSGGTIENNYMTQSRLDTLWAAVGGWTYRPASLSFLGDLRLDAGDLITYVLSDGTRCTVPVMNLTHTFDGGVTTQIESAGESGTASDISGGGTLTGKVRQLTADVAQLGALTVTDENGTTKINGGRIDTDSLFAQDITATGSISGIKLLGKAIDIQAVDADHASTAYLKTDLKEHEFFLRMRCKKGNTMGAVDIDCGGVTITGSTLNINVDQLITDCISDTYASFDGRVVSEGSVTVVQKLGWCLVHGSIKLTDTVSDMTNILDNSKVPAPQHGVGIYTTALYWTSSYVRAMRVGVGAGGSLRIQYGAAGTYTFSITYPIK